MNSIVIAIVTFAFCLGGAFLGRRLRRGQAAATPGAKEGVKAAFWLVAAVSVLIVGLMSATRSSFDDADRTVKQIAAGLQGVDRALAEYGPETHALRAQLQAAARAEVDALQDPPAANATTRQPSVDEVVDAVRRLTPTNDHQRAALARALEQAPAFARNRWAALAEAHRAMSPVLVAVVVVWLGAAFASFALYRRAPGGSIAIPLAGALAAACAMFLILEFAMPFQGTFRVSLDPLRDAAAALNSSR